MWFTRRKGDIRVFPCVSVLPKIFVHRYVLNTLGPYWSLPIWTMVYRYVAYLKIYCPNSSNKPCLRRASFVRITVKPVLSNHLKDKWKFSLSDNWLLDAKIIFSLDFKRPPVFRCLIVYFLWSLKTGLIIIYIGIRQCLLEFYGLYDMHFYL